MRVTLTGATGRIGRSLVEALVARGDEVTVLSRNAASVRERLGGADVHAETWDPSSGPAPASALSGRDVIVHLAGEDLVKRWTKEIKHEIRASREVGTRNLVAGIEAADPRPKALVSASASGFYGPQDDRPIDEDAPPASDFLAQVVVAWEREARRAEQLGVRVALMRTGVVLSAGEGALQKMLPPFKLGVGGPIGGGRQYMPWIHLDDVVGLYLRAIDDPDWSGPFNTVAPGGVSNKDFSKALGKALRRPAVLPVPGVALKVLYGEMGQIVLTGVNMVPRRAREHGYEFEYPEVLGALKSLV